MSAGITNIAAAEAARLTDELLSKIIKRPVRASPDDPQAREMRRILSAAVRRSNEAAAVWIALAAEPVADLADLRRKLLRAREMGGHTCDRGFTAVFDGLADDIGRLIERSSEGDNGT